MNADNQQCYCGLCVPDFELVAVDSEIGQVQSENTNRDVGSASPYFGTERQVPRSRFAPVHTVDFARDCT